MIPFADVARQKVEAMWFAGGYPDPAQLAAPCRPTWRRPACWWSRISSRANSRRPRRSSSRPRAAFEKDGTFVNHAGLAQTFPRAVRPPVEARTELQLAFDLLGRRGLVQPAAIRAELAQAMPEFAALGEKNLPADRRAVRAGDGVIRVLGPTITVGIVMVAT